MPELWKLLDWIDRIEKFFAREKSTIKQTEIMNISKATLTGIKNQVRDLAALLNDNFVPMDSERLHEAIQRIDQIFEMVDWAETDAGIAEEISAANNMNLEHQKKTIDDLKARFPGKDFSGLISTITARERLAKVLENSESFVDTDSVPDFRKAPEVFKGGDAKQLAAHLAKQK